MNPPSSNNGFTLAPMGSQQFYQMAQHHALANTPFMPPVMPGYLPLADSSDVYASMMPMGAYNGQPQLLPTHHAEPSTAPDMWNGYTHVPQAQPTYESFPPVQPMTQTMHNLERSYGQASASPSAVPSTTIPVAATASSSSSTTPSGATSCEAISDEPFADEHKWRKYGQKQVKRSPYPRNYYKCTISGCPAKKHLEKFWDTAANKERCRTIYIGEHAHPAAVSPQVFVSTQQDFRSSVLAQSAKIRLISLNPPSSEEGEDMSAQQRLVVECSTQVDENEDGYYWRKYGQKSVKGSCTPRQYYRCRNANCPVKKTVEASSKGNTIVSYDGPHNHDAGVVPDCPVGTSIAPTIQQQQHQHQHQHLHVASTSNAIPLPHYYAQQHQQQQQHQQPQQHYQHAQQAYPVSFPASHRSSISCSSPSPVPTINVTFKREYSHADAPTVAIPDVYSQSTVESPSSTLSTTEEEESYFSEPSPKRFKSEASEDATYDASAVHSYSADAPPAHAWHSLWDAQFNDFLVTE